MGSKLEQVYLDQKAQGRRLELYSCAGPSRLLDFQIRTGPWGEGYGLPGIFAIDDWR